MWKACDFCQGPIQVKPSQAHKKKYCSSECRRAANTQRVATQQEEARAIFDSQIRQSMEQSQNLPAPAAEVASQLPADQLKLTPEQADRLRWKIGQYLNDVLPLAAEVIKGSITWTPVQAGVFKTLLAKAVPDLNATLVKNVGQPRNLDEMSIDELQMLATELAKRKALPHENHPAEGSQSPDDALDGAVREADEGSDDAVEEDRESEPA